MTKSVNTNPKRVGKETTGDSKPVEVKFHKINREIKSPVTVNDFMKMEIPAPKELVDGLIQNGLTMLIAGSKKFRTALALYMAACVSSGQQVFGKLNTKQSRVLYICLSEDTVRFNNRVRALADFIGVLHFELTTVEKYKDSQFLSRLYHYIDKRRVELVVIDTLDDVLDVRTKNSRYLKAEFIRKLRALANDMQTAILVINHSDQKDLSENLFQAKTLEAGSDNVILVSSVYSENQRDILTLRHYGRLYAKRDIFLERIQGEQAFTKLDEIPVLESEVELLEKVTLLANAGLNQREMGMILSVTQGYVSKILKKVEISSPDTDVVQLDDIEEFLTPSDSDEFEVEEEDETESGDPDSDSGKTESPEKGEQDEPEII
ncbi:MAG: AAA family ATPase [Candidatus Paceibacterota bacterium]